MRKIALIVITFFLLQQSASAAVPAEIQGVWVVDIPQTIDKMQADGVLDASTIAYMQKRILPAYKRTIESGKMINQAASGTVSADISLQKQQGETFVMQLSSELNGKKSMFSLHFIMQSNGKLIMSTNNKEDGSDSIIWMRQQ